MRTRLLILLAVTLALLLPTVVWGDNTEHGIRVIILDAGHGEWDPGCMRNGVREKDITLKVVLRLGKLIEREMPGVKVCYTRKTDKALGPDKRTDLRARAKLANDMKGDLMLSVHVNAAKDPRACGVETLIMGETPFEQRGNKKALMESNREDLFDMSDAKTAAMVRAYIQNMQFSYGEYSMAMAKYIQSNYKKDGRVMRKIKAQPLMVLYATNMPGVLTEIGFLSNARERALMTSEKGLDQIARSLFRAVKEYSARIAALRSGATHIEALPEVEETSEEEILKLSEEDAKAEEKPAEMKPAAKPASNLPVHYAVQVMASDKKFLETDSKFKKYRGKVKRCIGSGALRYKYCVGHYSSFSAARHELKKIRTTFPDAFIVRCQGEQIIK